MWSSLRRFSPLRAFLDLRRFLGTRGKHEVIFLFASLAVCILVLSFFISGSTVTAPYRAPDIIYVQSWPANRTDAEIIAQQKIDLVKERAAKAEKAAEQAEIRARYKRLSDQMNAIGI